MTEKITVRWDAGALIRGQILREVKCFLDGQDVEYTVNEYGGWFETKYRVTITGEAANACGRHLQAWFIDMDNSSED